MIALSDVLQSISVIFACWAVVAGIGAWRREFVGKRRIELAEETLEAFFAIRDAVAYIRNPFSNTTEGRSREKREYETKAETEILNRAYIVFERYQAKNEVFARFATLKYRFMAAFGKDTEDIFVKANKTVNRIFVAAQMLGTHYWLRQGRVQMEQAEFTKHLDEMHREEEVFWDHDKEDDEIRTGLNSVLADLERVTGPTFQETTTLYGYLTSRLLKK